MTDCLCVVTQLPIKCNVNTVYPRAFRGVRRLKKNWHSQTHGTELNSVNRGEMYGTELIMPSYQSCFSRLSLCMCVSEVVYSEVASPRLSLCIV